MSIVFCSRKLEQSVHFKPLPCYKVWWLSTVYIFVWFSYKYCLLEARSHFGKGHKYNVHIVILITLTFLTCNQLCKDMTFQWAIPIVIHELCTIWFHGKNPNFFFVKLMWLACHKKSYLICDEITNFWNIM